MLCWFREYICGACSWCRQASTFGFLQMIIIGVKAFVVCGKIVFTFRFMALTDNVISEVLAALTVKITIVM
jgi:hypothetical protein